MHFKLSTSFMRRLAGLTIAIWAGTPGFAQSVGATCGTLSAPGQYGPYDFRTDGDMAKIVLKFHFTPADEALLTTRRGPPGGAIDYTLRALPNFHRALMAMVRLGEKEKTTHPSGSTYSIDCWFERALLFRPDDAVVRMIYSTYLDRQGRSPDANAQLERATVDAKDNALTHYNIGMHYFKLKNYDKALEQAHLAIALGWPQTDLRDQLQRVGKWHEPAPPSALPATDRPSAESAR